MQNLYHRLEVHSDKPTLKKRYVWYLHIFKMFMLGMNAKHCGTLLLMKETKYSFLDEEE